MRYPDDRVQFFQAATLLFLFNIALTIALLFRAPDLIPDVLEQAIVNSSDRDMRMTMHLFWPYLLMGIFQWIYVVPACLYCARKRRFNFVKG